jgi:hypothetical protein
MDILQYIHRINQLYGSESQVASGKGFGSVIPEEFDELSPREEQYYQQGPFSTREDFLAAQGGPVYDTRKYFKPGGLVEPGVTHYAKATVDDLAQGVKAGDELGDNIYQRKGGYELQMGSGDNRITRHGQSLDKIKTYKDQVISEGWEKKPTGPKEGRVENMFKDDLFEQYFDSELKQTKGIHESGVNAKIKKALADLPENATLKQKWEHLLTKDYTFRQGVIRPFLRKFKGKYKRDAGYLSLKQLSDFTEFSKPTLTEAFFYNDKYKGVMPDVTKVSSAEYSKAKRGFEIVKQLEDIGITQQKIPGTYRASPTGKFKGKLALRLFNLPEDDQIIKLRNMVKMKGEESPTARAIVSKASKNSPEYLKMQYSKDRGNMNKLLKVLNASVKNLDEVELLKLIKNNPALEELVTSHFNSVTGEIKPVKLDDLTFNEIKHRIGFEKEHVRSFKTAKIDPITKKVLDGFDIEYPKHLRISIRGFNYPVKDSAERWVQNNIKNINDPIIKGKIDKIDNFFTKFGQAYTVVDPTTNKRVIRGATEANLLKNIQALGFTGEEKMFKQAGFNFDHCKLKAVGGSYNTCVRDTIEAEQKKALDGDVKAKSKFKKFGRFAGGFIGWVDAPIELAFALPHMLRGDVNAAKRATTLGLTGWGSNKELEISRKKSPMAYRSFKRKRDMDNYIDNWFRSETDKQTLKTAPEEFKSDLKQNITTSLTNMEGIAKNFPASDPEIMYREDKRGREYIREEAEKRARAGLTLAPELFGGIKFAPGAEGQKLDTLEKHIKYKGEPYWKNIEPMLEDLNYPFALHPYEVKDYRDRYSELPIKLASELGPLEAKETQTALDYLESEKIPFYNTGGRVPFGKGKLAVTAVDKGRRAFMKWLAGLTGAGIAAGTGLIKFGAIVGKGKTVIKAGDTIIQGTPGMPSWYIPLVNRIVKEGDNVTKKLSTIEREIVHTKKISKTDEVTVYNNLDTGNVRIEYGPHQFDKKGNVIRATNDVEVVHLEYRAPEIVESGKHAGKKTKPEFSATEAKPRVTNWEGDIEWEHMDIDKNVDDLLTDTSKLKQFGTKKKLTHKDKVIAKKKQTYQKKLEKDPSEQLEYIEKKEGATIDDLLDEGKAVGEFDPKGYDTHNTWKGMNLPTKKIKKASGGLASYDNYLPDIEDID